MGKERRRRMGGKRKLGLKGREWNVMGGRNWFNTYV